MAFPAKGWPPRPASGTRSIRFFKRGTATGNWSDNAYLFIDGLAANTFVPMPYVKPGDITPIAIGSIPMGTGENPNDIVPGDTVGHVKAAIWANNIRICNDSGANELEYSFSAADDAGATNTQIHGVLRPNEVVLYRNRAEAGIAVRSAAGAAFRIEAW